MKTKRFISIMVLLSTMCLAQENTFNKEDELQKFVQRGGKVEEVSLDIYKLTYRSRESRVFNFSRKEKVNEDTISVDTTIINVWEIDTTLYAYKFKFWQRVDIVNNYRVIVPVEDLNHNGLLELYGLNEYSGIYAGPVVIFEQDNAGIFNKVYTYDSNSVFVQGIGDIDSDGEKEIFISSIDTIPQIDIYRSDSSAALPTTFDFIFYYNSHSFSIYDMSFGDFDNNGITDCVFESADENGIPRIIISEFKDSINNFSTVYELITSDSTTVNVPSGFAIGDFDNDSKTELISGSTQGIVYSIEVVKENLYELVWQGLAPTYNAYMIASTNDIDGNGKPEFWVGGQDFGTGISTFWCYESDGDNNYITVAEIQLRYLVSLYANYLQSADIDNDGRDELIISLGNYLLILKFTGKPNQHSYEIFYAKIDELSQPGAEFLPVTIADLNEDDKKDILLPMDKYINPNTDLFSYLLVQDTVTSMQDDNAQNLYNFDLLQNYPNPFNPFTQVTAIVSEQSSVKVVVYDILGKEITTLLDENLSAGEYTIQWNGEDSGRNYLAGGIYFIRMKANGFSKTIKAVLLK
jgi:hypothetical protein